MSATRETTNRVTAVHDMLDALAKEAMEKVEDPSATHLGAGMALLVEMADADVNEVSDHIEERVARQHLPILAMKADAHLKTHTPEQITAAGLATAMLDGFVLGAAWAKSNG